jgi:cell division GTPase FtsZ
MKLLTIGTGKKGAEVSSLLARKGVKVNGVPLFKCYGVTNSVEELKSIKLSQKNKFYLMLGNRKVDVRSILNVILGRNEIFEGSLIITSLDDEFGVSSAIEFGERLMEYHDDPVIGLGIVPPFESMSPAELRERIKRLKEIMKVLILVEENKTNDFLVKALNILARVGEIDIKKRIAGEVVVDTSDVFNSLVKEGFSMFGFAERKLPITWFGKILLRRDSELIAVRTQRMTELVKEAMENVSVQGDVETAKSALIIFAGSPNEITMDGLFSSIELVEGINEDIIVRYGDYPMPNSKMISVVLLFSGITRFKL